MTSEPLFSIILPTYDRPKYLREAIASVLGQTMTDFELLVVDDGSRVPVVVPEDPRITLVRLEVNKGPAVARNAGLDVAAGEYLTFLDDDDVFTPHRLELALPALDRCSIALCWAQFLDEEDGSGGRYLDGWVEDSILDASTPTLGCAVVRCDLAVRFDERWHAVEDLVWWLEMAGVAPVTTAPQYGYLVRRHEGPRNRNHLSARIEENLRFMEAFEPYFSAHRRSAAFRLKRIGLMARAVGDRSLARRAFLQSLGQQPELATAWHAFRTSVGR